MADGRARVNRVRSVRWWLAARILGPHGHISRRLTHDEFAEVLRKTHEEDDDE